jgi:hypothetical protein
MRRALSWLAVVFALVPGRANAQYTAAPPNPAAAAANANALMNANAAALNAAANGANAGNAAANANALMNANAAALNAAANGANAGNAAANANALMNANAAALNAAATGLNAAAVNAPAAGAYPTGADQQAQQYYYLYQSLLYGFQGTGAVGYVTPEAQAQTARALSEYFTNGAAMTAVPTSGPGAAYFTNGAQATTLPTSSMPDYAFSPPLAPAPSFAVDAGAPAQAVPPPAETGVAPAPTAPAPTAQPTTVTANEPA